MLAAALISIVPVEEIIWKTGQVSVEPHAFQRAALRLIVPEIKVGHWLTSRSFEWPPSPQGRPSVILGSKVLAPFFGREFETVASILPRAGVEKRALAVTDFLVLHGPPLFNDMPLCVPDHDFLHLRLRDRGLMNLKPVLLLRIEAGPAPNEGLRKSHGLPDKGGFGRRAMT
ncbi:MAG: hypothetical protein RL230_1824 [Pseudomonadota bacterium]|jgi:hypothetical protein